VEVAGTPQADRICKVQRTIALVQEICSNTKPRKACPAGRYGATSNLNDCQSCAAGTYTSLEGQSSCQSTSSCLAGSYIAVPATTSTDAVCADCTLNVEWQSAPDQYRCKPLTTCGLGKYISVSASLSSDVICTSCPANTFSAGTNAELCLPVSKCGIGFGEVRATILLFPRYLSHAPPRSLLRLLSRIELAVFVPKD